jgi:hypothetical protein
MIRSALALLPLLSAALSAQQDSAGVCYRARPLPPCRVVVLTNAGGYATPMRTFDGGTRFRAIVDWGFIVNTTARDAVGASAFLMLDENEFSAGAAMRYRRWLSPRRSLDISVGTPLSDGDLRRGSVLGMIKYNPDHWVGFALRPEYARRQEFTCNPACVERTVSTGRVYGGVELGWYPGLGVSLGGGVFVALLAIARAGVD